MRAVQLSALAALLAILCAAPSAFAQTPPPTGLIVNRNSGMCLETPIGPPELGAAATQGQCVDAARQRWIFEAISDGYRIISKSSGECLQVHGEKDGAQLVRGPCQGKLKQRFKLRKRTNWVELLVFRSGKCVGVDGRSLDPGAAIVQTDCDGAFSEMWTLSGKAAVSEWSPKYQLPLVPVAASTLRNGKILAWSSHDRFDNAGYEGKTYTTTFDPQTNSATERLVSNTGHDMFCPGTATLPDGRILVNGGSSSSKTSIYDPATNAWTTGATMNVPRGYQGDTVLSTGEVLTVGGSWTGGEGGKIGEAWTQTGGWRRLPDIVAESLAGPDPRGVYRGDNHMWLFGVEDGYAFHAGPSAEMHWISTKGDGAITDAGPRGNDVYSINGNVVFYDVGKLLKAGGAPAYENTRATTSAYVVDFSGGPDRKVVVRKQKPMAFPRAFANAVALPNGQVVVLGGMTYPIPFHDERSILVPEIWTPSTGAFQRLDPMTTPRNYHSVATLMLDGRIWAAGGGLCGGCPTNHPDAEILTPPYLLKPDGSAAARPEIKASPKRAEPGGLISVATEGEVTSFALIRLSAVTHSVSNDQRRIPLPIESRSGDAYKLRLPSSRGVLLPGDWMLFAMTKAGTPSIAKILRVS